MKHAEHRRKKSLSGAYHSPRTFFSYSRDYRPRIQSRPRKLDRDKVLDIIRAEVVRLASIPVSHGFGGTRVTAEGLATQFNLQLPKVNWALMKLNTEGLVSRRINVAPHDSPRERHMFYGLDSAWQASYYRLLKQERLPVFPDRSDDIPIHNSPRKTMFVFDERESEGIPKKPRYSKRLHRRVA